MGELFSLPLFVVLRAVLCPFLERACMRLHKHALPAIASAVAVGGGDVVFHNTL